jgi:MYXO-CTERM domain-containing protein
MHHFHRNGFRFAGILALLAGSIPVFAAPNMVINGDFENNTAGSTQYNLPNVSFNALMANCTAFGDAEEIDIIDPSSPYGLPPVSGKWKIALHHVRNGTADDALSFDLTAPIVMGTTYKLSFYAQSVLDFDPGPAAVEVGLSNSATAFGTLAYSGTPSTSAWTLLGTTFTASMNAQYLTMRADANNTVWNHVDAVSLEVVPEPSALGVVGLAGIAALRRRIKRS